MIGRIKVYYAVWDCEFCRYSIHGFNSTDLEEIRISLMNYISEDQDQDTINDLDDLSAEELSRLINVRIEESFNPFSEDSEFIAYQ